MSFDVNWNIDKYQEEHESDDHWELRRNFMDRWKQSYPEDRLVCLSRVFANIELMGCRYPQEVMQEVALMSKEVNKNITFKNYTTNITNFSGQSLPQGSVSAHSKMPRNEIVQESIISVPVDTVSYIDYPNQEHGDVLYPSNEVIPAPVLVSEVLRTPYESFDMPDPNFDSNNSFGLKDSEEQLRFPNFVQSAEVGEDNYQNIGSSESLWHRRDPRIQVSAIIQKDTGISQPDRIQSTNWQTRDPRIQFSINKQREAEISQERSRSTSWQAKDPRNQASVVTQNELEISQGPTQTTNNYWQAQDPTILDPAEIQKESDISQHDEIQCLNQLTNQGIGHVDDTHNVNQYGPPPQTTLVNAEKYYRDKDTTLDLPNAAQDQTISTNDNNSHELNIQSCGFGNMAIASGSGLITQPQQMAYGAPSQIYNESFQNNYNEIDPSTYSGTYPFDNQQKTSKMGKHNIIVSGKQLKGSTARRYAYWINVGKTQQEAEYLCHIRMSLIPEYDKLKKTVGTLCQLKSLKGDRIPTFKKKKVKQQRPLKKIPVGNKQGEAAIAEKSCVGEEKRAANNVKSIFDTPTEFKSGKQFKRYKFWLSIGKSEDEARILSKQGFHRIPLANELRAQATEKGHAKHWIPWAQRKYLNQQRKTKSLQTNKKTNLLQGKEQLNVENSVADETINTTEIRETANVPMYEDPDIIEITIKEPDTIVISDDEEIDKLLPIDTNMVNTEKMNAVKQRIDNEIQRKRFDWWMQQGKSQEEATILSQTPMAISDALDNISNYKTIIDKELQEKNQLLNAKKTYSKDDYTPMPMTVSNTMNVIKDKTDMIHKSQLHENWLTLKARENQKIQEDPITMPTIANSNVIDGNSTAANSNTLHFGNNVAETEINKFNIYIEEASGKIGYTESLQIRDAIAQCIIDDDEMTMPTCGSIHGCFVVFCADEQTRDSLDKQIPTLEPWKGARLKIIDKIRIENHAYASLFIPSIPESGIKPTTQDTEVLKKLHELNPKMGCTTWEVLSHKTQVHKSGRLLTVRFDRNADNELKAVGYKLKWFLRPIKVKIKLNTKRINKHSGKEKMVILDPPNIEVIKSASLVTGKVQTIIPLSEAGPFENPYNTAEETTRLMAPSIIGDEGIPMKISNSPSPSMLDYSEQAVSSNYLASLKEKEQVVSNYEQPSNFAEQASQSTHHTSSTIADKLRKRKLVDSAGYWRTDAPWLLPGHMNAVKWTIENNGCFEADSDDTGREYCYNEVKPFCGEDEEYSIEERVSVERRNRSFEAFNIQKSYQSDRGREYSQKRVLDEREPVNSQEDRTIEDYSQEKLVLVGHSQEYARDNRFSDRQSAVYSRESRFDDEDAECSRSDRIIDRCQDFRRVPSEHERQCSLEDRIVIDSQEERVLINQSQKYSTEDNVLAGRSEEYSSENRFSRRRSAEYSGETEHSRKVFDEPRRQEYSKEVFNEHETRGLSKDRIIYDDPQKERVIAEPSREYSRDGKYSGKRNPDYSIDDGFDDNGAEFSKNERVRDERCQEYYREVIDEHGRKDPSEDRGFQDSSQRALSSQEYNTDNRTFLSRNQEYLGIDRFSDRQSSEYSGMGKIDERDAYTRKLSDEHEGASSRKDIDIKGAPPEVRVLTGQSRDHSRDGRYSEKNRFDEQDIYNKRYSNNDRRFDRLDQEYRQERGLAERDEYSRKDRNIDQRDKYSWKLRDADRDQQYSKDDRDYYQQGGSTHKSFQTSDRPYIPNFDNTSQRSYSRPTGQGRTLKLQLSYHENKPNRKRSKKPMKKQPSL